MDLLTQNKRDNVLYRNYKHAESNYAQNSSKIKKDTIGKILFY